MLCPENVQAILIKETAQREEREGNAKGIHHCRNSGGHQFGSVLSGCCPGAEISSERSNVALEILSKGHCRWGRWTGSEA
jgi:hypothetical protein